MNRALVAAVLACSTPACTLLAPLTTAGAVATHNSASDTSWAYGTPVIVSAFVGLGVDLILIALLGKQWSKPFS